MHSRRRVSQDQLKPHNKIHDASGVTDNNLPRDYCLQSLLHHGMVSGGQLNFSHVSHHRPDHAQTCFYWLFLLSGQWDSLCPQRSLVQLHICFWSKTHSNMSVDLRHLSVILGVVLHISPMSLERRTLHDMPVMTVTCVHFLK